MSSQNLLDRAKVVELVKPDAWATGAISASEIDTKGFRWATVIVHVGAAANVDANFVMTEKTASGGSATPIVDSGSVAAAFTIAQVNAADVVLRGEIDLMHTSRYIDATCNAAGATDMSAIVILSNVKYTGDLTAADTLFQILDRA